MDPVLAIVIIVALICATVVIVGLAKRGASRRDTPGIAAPSTAVVSTPERLRLASTAPPAPSLQTITFKQALETNAIAERLETLAKRQVEYAFGLKAANATVQAISLAEQHDKLVIAYEFSRHGETLRRAGQAIIPLHRDSGKLLPVLSDPNSGQFIELAKGTPLKLSKVANVMSLITGVAHVISGIDVVRRLKDLDRKLNLLVEGRTTDQLADFQTVYNRLAEIFSREDWRDREPDLRASHDELFKLRAKWRHDLQTLLRSAPETPHTKGVEEIAKKIGVFGLVPLSYLVGKSLEWRREGKEKDLFVHLAASADLIQRIRLAMLLDVGVAQALGEADILASVSMRNEIEMWDGIVDEFSEKRRRIKTVELPADLEAVQQAIETYTQFLHCTSDANPAAASREIPDTRVFTHPELAARMAEQAPAGRES